jgi:DNA-binding transcriptional ArsR family regulator
LWLVGVVPVEAVSVDLLELIARRMRAIAEPSRMQIILLLEQREGSVQEIADELVLPHQNASVHLNVLLRAGIVSRHKEGRRARYALADYTAADLLRSASASAAGYIEELADLTKPRE